MSVYLQDADLTLYCADARDVLATLPAASIDAVVTDPPYGQTSLTWDVPVRDWLGHVDRVLKPTGSVWVFGSLRMFMAQADEFRGWTLAQDIVWEKHNGSNFHADRFRRVHEQAAQFYRGRWDQVYHSPLYTHDATKRTLRRKTRPPHMGHIEEGAYASEDGGPRLQRSVMLVRSCHGSAIHETQKPEGIIRPLIEYACPPGGLVLDPFAGSGSVGIAARQLGRHSLLIEVNADYCAGAAARLAQLAIGLPA